MAMCCYVLYCTEIGTSQAALPVMETVKVRETVKVNGRLPDLAPHSSETP